MITAFQVEKDPDLLRDYDKIIQEQEQTRIVERVPEEESSSNVDKEQFKQLNFGGIFKIEKHHVFDFETIQSEVMEAVGLSTCALLPVDFTAQSLQGYKCHT